MQSEDVFDPKAFGFSMHVSRSWFVQCTYGRQGKVILQAYQKFCGAARRDGHDFKTAAALWQSSSLRKALVEQLSVAERKKRKFTLDD